MKIAIVKETRANETRVAGSPEVVKKLIGLGFQVVVQQDAGRDASFTDATFRDAGATIAKDARAALKGAGMVFKIQAPQAGEIPAIKKGTILVASLGALSNPKEMQALARAGLTSFAMELMPRISRAQSMDILSSQSNLAGYKAVLDAASEFGRAFPMMMTAAGTVPPAKVFIMGVGVAGLQAIATANRLGAVVRAYDVRPEVKEQVESLGAKFVELPLESADAQDKGGYAKDLGEDFYRRQQELMGRVVAESDVVITTAMIPGKAAPLLVTTEMIEGMTPGSVVVDLAAERGGNCEPTQPDEVIDHAGVTVLGPTNLPSTVPYHASQMYAKNVTTLLLHLLDEGRLAIDRNDEITAGTLITHEGEILHDRVRDALNEPA